MNIRIIGLGNVLMSDDGFGPYVVRVLEARYQFPESVHVIDAGTPGLDLTPYLIDADVVIFVDTVSGPGVAGDMRCYRRDEILAHAPQPRLSPHDPGVKDALLTLAAAGVGPSDAVMFGVIPEWIATGVQLSASVRAAIDPIIALVLTELDRHGVRAKLRATPRVPDTWWERESESPNARAVRV